MTIPPTASPIFNVETLVQFHTHGAASALVAMLRPGGAA